MRSVPILLLTGYLTAAGCAPAAPNEQEATVMAIDSFEQNIHDLAASQVEKGLLYDRISGEQTIVSVNGTNQSAEIDLDLLASHIQIGGSYAFIHNHVQSPAEVLGRYKNLVDQSKKAAMTLGDVITLLENGQQVGEYTSSDAPFLRAKQERFLSEHELWNAYVSFYEQDLAQGGQGSNVINVIPSTEDMEIFQKIQKQIMAPQRAQCIYIIADAQGYMSCQIRSPVSEERWLEWKDNLISSAPAPGEDSQSWQAALMNAKQAIPQINLDYRKYADDMSSAKSDIQSASVESSR